MCFSQKDSALLFLLGISLGSGGSFSSLLAYSTEKQFSKRKDEFGQVAVKGLVGSKSTNDASAVGFHDSNANHGNSGLGYNSSHALCSCHDQNYARSPFG